MENKINELNCWVAVLILMLFWFIVYSCVQVNKLNRRIDTTQQLVMDYQCPVATGDKKVYDEIHEIKWYLGYIKTTTDQIFESFPSYIYKQPNEFDGKICDDANYCQRYIFLDDEPYNDNQPTTNS